LGWEVACVEALYFILKMSDFSSRTDVTLGIGSEARRQYFDDKTEHRVDADKAKEATTTPEGGQ
jgi:hypothetical protein